MYSMIYIYMLIIYTEIKPNNKVTLLFYINIHYFIFRIKYIK